ncbi:TIGR04282 family arsenosugar biosynthesis glycosyltransferase [Geomonas sp. RF6]|uniref:TIGR04282 family arsenosugar biosynthesis glycosyltransferase n=1 Tax=Geomonas sp. RF6 TaxID=2897342 RepID=UPI001E4ED55A|nr:TIGR04282 family arsenosugar biosynthesis glycosyltransferase [Geomonas sp. RF6]UFS72467.1 TIGR04282 family arsenosugar biosynthesis glycosyltransferase [Geomonas sp. RF6]
MKVALAVFAKAPVPGAVKTRLSPQLTSSESAELYRCMLLDTVQRVSLLPWDPFIFYEGERAFFEGACPGIPLLPQVEAGLGERMAAAVESTLALGYGASMVIGTDVPDLPLSYLEEGVRLLKSGADVVFGPAADGGYYLVGLKRVERAIFQGIRWSTSSVLAESLKRAESAALKAGLLPLWYDVDSYEDLLRPGLLDIHNKAPLTRTFLTQHGIVPREGA